MKSRNIKLNAFHTDTTTAGHPRENHNEIHQNPHYAKLSTKKLATIECFIEFSEGRNNFNPEVLLHKFRG